MLKVQYRKKGIKLAHIYFYGDDYSNLKNDIKGADIVFMHGCYTKPEGGVFYTHQNTLIKDLTLSEDEIFASFGKHLRKHLRKSEQDNVEIICFLPEQILSDLQILADCRILYEKMFQDKGMKSTFNTNLAKRYCDNKSLMIIMAKIESKPIGFSAIIYDENNARAWVGAFDFRNEENDSQVLSRAHQRLNWERMKWCKAVGIKYFDFGGINSFTEPNGIAQFKMEFESENRISYDNYLIPNSMLGKIALKRFME